MHSFRKNNERGFTLIELMIVMVLVSLLAALALPNFSRLQRSGAVNKLTRESFRILQIARTEALSRGTSVAVTCSQTTASEVKLSMFLDADQDGVAASANDILEEFPEQLRKDKDNLKSSFAGMAFDCDMPTNAAGDPAVVFDSRGFARDVTANGNYLTGLIDVNDVQNGGGKQIQFTLAGALRVRR